MHLRGAVSYAAIHPVPLHSAVSLRCWAWQQGVFPSFTCLRCLLPTNATRLTPPPCTCSAPQAVLLGQLDGVRRELVEVVGRWGPHIMFGKELVREVLAFAQVGAGVQGLCAGLACRVGCSVVRLARVKPMCCVPTCAAPAITDLRSAPTSTNRPA